MAKVEVQIRSCFCCGLSLGTIFIALYTLLLYALLCGLAIWAVNDTAANGDTTYYNSCEQEALGIIRNDNRKLVFQGGHTTVIVEDSTSYHCSFGLYTEEAKYSKITRYSLLVFNIILYALLILASIILLVGLYTYTEWLLVPWIILMFVDIIRGFVSTIFIFIYSHGNLARIATGIFFLGLQFFHISILLIIVAKFQRIHNRKKGIVIDPSKQYDPRLAYPPPGSVGPYANYGYAANYPPSAEIPRVDPAQYDPQHPPQPRYYDGGHRY